MRILAVNWLDLRNPHFHGHSRAVSMQAAAIAAALGMCPDEIESVRTAGLLHDVGMMAVPDALVEKEDALTDDELKGMLYEITPEPKVKTFEETGDIDFGYEIPGLARYRANFFRQREGVGAVFREIPSEVMTAEQLGLPPILL